MGIFFNLFGRKKTEANQETATGKKTRTSKSKSKGEKLAKSIMDFADDNRAAASKSQFGKYLSQVKTLSTADMIKFMRSFDKDESVMELICDETGSSKSDRKKACMTVFNALVSKAKAKGIDIGELEEEFSQELNHQFDSWGFVNTKKMDRMVNVLVSQLEGREDLTRGDRREIRRTSRSTGYARTNKIFEKRLERAYAAFGERVGEDGEMTTRDRNGRLYNGQMQRDGWAADTADYISRIWGSNNTADKVRRDLKISAAQLKELQEAQKRGGRDFEAKFEAIFGVPYDYTNIAAYQKAERQYKAALKANETEQYFNRTCRNLLKDQPLSSEYLGFVSAEEVYDREYKALAGRIQNGDSYIQSVLKSKGLTNGTPEQKYEILQEIAKTLSRDLHQRTLKAGGGRSFADAQMRFNNAYTAAYGHRNDIMRRVTEYNISQEAGAAIVRGIPVMAASVAVPITAGAGVALGAAAGSAFVSGASDRLTSGKALHALNTDGIVSYLKTAGKDTDWRQLLTKTATSGGAVFVGDLAAQGVCVTLGKTTNFNEAVGSFCGSLLTDSAGMYLTEGKISIGDKYLSVLVTQDGQVVGLGD